jgi:hypothetical protein
MWALGLLVVGLTGCADGADGQTCVGGVNTVTDLADAVCDELKSDELVDACSTSCTGEGCVDASGLRPAVDSCAGPQSADPPIDLPALVSALSFIPNDAIPDATTTGSVSWEDPDSGAHIEIDLDAGEFNIFGGHELCEDPDSGEPIPCDPPIGNGTVDDPSTDYENYLPMLGIDPSQCDVTTWDTEWGPGLGGLNISVERRINGVLVGNHMNFDYSFDTGLVGIWGRWNPIDYASSQLAVDGSVSQAARVVANAVHESGGGEGMESIFLQYRALPEELAEGEHASLDLQIWAYGSGGSVLEIDI